MKKFQYNEECIEVKSLNYLRILPLVTFLIGISLSCSKNLSRNEASQLVEKYLQSQDETTAIEFGNDVFLWDFEERRIQRLAKAGLMHISSNYSRHKIQFTDEGKKYFASEAREVRIGVSKKFEVEVKLAEKRLVEVTGMTEAPFFPEKKAFNIEYKWKYGNFTPFGENEAFSNERIWSEEVRDKIFDGKAMIRLYDDGWRIAK